MMNFDAKTKRKAAVWLLSAFAVGLFFPSRICAQQVAQSSVTVSGNVTDDSGQPLIGVNVVVQGTTIGTNTNMAGVYTLKIPDKQAILEFSYLGYATRQEKVGGRSIINVTLTPSAESIGEVTVVAYGHQKKASVVGAISSAELKSFKIPVRSMSNILAGNVSGIIGVQRTGEPGKDNANFWIRGIGTFGQGGSSPLIMVDGIERSLNDIEPEDIEEFSVLKDAAATAIYGVRGANGAILITTKKGRDAAPSITLKYERGIMGATKLPKFVNGPQYAQLFDEANLATNPMAQPRYTPEIIQKIADGSEPYIYPNVNWIDATLKEWTSNQRALINVSGGGSRARYYASGSYYSEKGLYKQDAMQQYNSNAKYERFNFRVNTDIDITKSILLTMGISAILQKGNYPGASAGDIFSWILRSNPLAFSITYPGGKIAEPTWGSHRNPYGLITQSGYRQSFETTVQSNVGLKYEFQGALKGLSAQARFAFDSFSYHNINRTKDPDTYEAIPPYYDENNELILKQNHTGNTYLQFGKSSAGNRRTYIEFALNYQRDFGNHSVGALLLYNQSDYVDANAGNSISALPYRNQGLAGRLMYSYDNRYFMEANFGYNGSENFAKGKRFGFFPSVAAGWAISEESFFKNNVEFIEFLKLRISYGMSGNDDIGGRRFAYLTTMGGGNGGYYFGSNRTNYFGGVGEDQWGADLTWEKSAKFNIGLDIRFLKGFYLQADMFREKRTDIFLQRGDLPLVLGVKNQPWGNLGEMHNQGFDSTLEYQKQFKDFGFTLRGNFTFARNKVVNMNEPDYKYPYMNHTGHRMNEYYGLIATGLFKDQDEIDRSPIQNLGTTPRPGDIKYVDLNSDGVVDQYDVTALGNAHSPEIVYGFGGTFVYKNIDLSLFFQGVSNVSLMLEGNGLYPFTEGGTLGNVFSEVWSSRWTEQNPDPNAKFPRLYYGKNSNNYTPSTFWMRNGSFLRLKSVELGYNFPKRLVKKLRLGGIRIYASGVNLFTWSEFKLWDPEIGGGNGAIYPPQRVINLGVNINL